MRSDQSGHVASGLRSGMPNSRTPVRFVRRASTLSKLFVAATAVPWQAPGRVYDYSKISSTVDKTGRQAHCNCAGRWFRNPPGEQDFSRHSSALRRRDRGHFPPPADVFTDRRTCQNAQSAERSRLRTALTLLAPRRYRGRGETGLRQRPASSHRHGCRPSRTIRHGLDKRINMAVVGDGARNSSGSTNRARARIASRKSKGRDHLSVSIGPEESEIASWFKLDSHAECARGGSRGGSRAGAESSLPLDRELLLRQHRLGGNLDCRFSPAIASNLAPPRFGGRQPSQQ